MKEQELARIFAQIKHLIKSVGDVEEMDLLYIRDMMKCVKKQMEFNDNRLPSFQHLPNYRHHLLLSITMLILTLSEVDRLSAKTKVASNQIYNTSDQIITKLKTLFPHIFRK